MSTIPSERQYALYDYSAGNATFTLQGTYTGTMPKDYVVQITVGGNTFADVRYRWSDTDGDTWNQENLIPVSGTPVTLSNGVQIVFTISTLDPEFVTGDEWDWRALRPYGISYALDGSRNTDYRSGTTPASSTIRIGFDLGTAQQPTFLALDDHNIPATGVTTLFAHATTLFTETGGFSQVCTWRANRINELITSGAFRYWWIRVVMPSSGMPAYLRLSGMFLGTGVTLVKQPLAGLTEHESFLGALDVPDTLSRGAGSQVHTAPRRQRTWPRIRRTPSADGGKLDAAFAYATTHPSYQMPPFFFIMSDTDLTTVEYNSWAGDLQRQHQFADLWSYSVDWISVIRTVA